MPAKISQSLNDKALKSLKLHFKTACNSSYLQTFSDKFIQPDIDLNQRGRVAGSAHFKKNLIRLNEILFEHNEAYFLNQVIPHELSHLLVAQMYNNRVKPHGFEWRRIMVDVFGLPPDTTHKLDTSVLGLKTFTYYCNCQTIELSQIRHNKIMKKNQSYICKRCGVTLQNKPNGF